MNIEKDTVVSIAYELFDMDGQLIEKTSEPVAYLHGGYQGIFEAVE
ncbi:MAG: peptidylprolyl isomerase, partial [Betaproteobacteria bacterium]|nr:peptidylprolyl isomerase [Betaproteobacteria bacterium]